MSGVQEYLIDQEIKYSKQLADFTINKALPTMFDVCMGMAKWLAGQSGGVKTGQQTLEHLTKYGDKLKEIPLNSDSIKDFVRIARKHNIAFALENDDSKTPPRHTVSFKAKDTESMTLAFNEYLAKVLNKSKTKEKSFKERLKAAKDKVIGANKDRATRRGVDER